MKTKKFFRLLFLATIVLLTSCSKDEQVATNGLCPLVVGTSPSDGEINVTMDRVVTVTFNKRMRESTITDASFSVEGTAPIEGTITFEENNSATTVIFTPNEDFLEDTTYTGRIRTTVKDFEGNAIQIAYVWNFTTGIIIRPIVVATDPIDAAVDVQLNKVITATFSEEMNPSTITDASFMLMNGDAVVPGAFAYFGALVSFTPTEDLLPGTFYTVKILNTVENMNAVTMVNDYVWNFTTGVLIAPTVILTSPLNNDINVELNKVLTATFSEVMNPATLNNSTFTLKRGTILVPVEFSFTDATVSFTPIAALLPNTIYTATITTGAQNPEGVGITADYVWSFTTIEENAPTIISTNPLNDAVDIPLNQIITATFSETMNQSTLNNTTVILMNGTTAVPVTFSFNNATVNISPTIGLLPNTVYTVTITTGAQNPAGVGLATNYVWSFTTGALITPTVILTNPLDNATNVPLGQNLSIIFSEAMNQSTINGTTFTLMNGTNVVPVTFSFSGATVTINPTNNLLEDTTYTATITTGAENPAGVGLANDYVWSFTTLTPTSNPPTVILTNPLDNATNVALGQNLSILFSEAMNQSTINGTTFTLTAGGNTVPVAFSFSGATVTINPTNNLLEDTTYTATITTGAENPAGVGLANDYVWSFTTTTLIAPTVILTSPLNNANNVALGQNLSILFSEAMNQSTINNTTFTLTAGGNTVPVAFSFSGATVTINPTNNLLQNTTYTATITTGAENPAGTGLAANYVWSFTTLTLVAPTVILTNPLNNANNVPLGQNLSILFSEAMNQSTINNTTFTLTTGGNTVPVAFSFSGATVTINPNNNLLENTTYTATITTGAENPAGTGLTANYVWSFTTLSLIAPTVLSTNPMDNANDVALNQTLTATFSEPMNQSTINNTTFTLMNGANTVPVTFSFSGSTVSFNPTNNLLENTTYTATITTGAENPAGTGLESDYVWSFTTLTVIVPPQGPQIGSLDDIGAFGGNAGITNQGINTVINNGGISTTAASTLVTGFHDGVTGDVYTETPMNVGLVTGGIFTNIPAPGTATSFAIAQQAALDATELYISISPAAMPGGIDPGAGELGGLTLAPGIYKSASGTFNISNGDLTLDAQGDPNAVWVFQTAAGLTVGIAGPTGAKSVNMINGANAANVFWQVGSTAVINGAGGGVMVGTIIANSGVTISTAGNAVQTVINGRAVSLIASVTMVNTTINVPN